MASQAQITANTLNAQRSTGPQTESGKSVSKLNAFRHGLTAATVVLPTEDMETYRQFSASVIASLEPVGAMEEQLAQLVADTHWRLNRIPALEANLFALAQLEPLPEHLANLEPSPARTALVEANALITHERQLRNLHLQEQRLHRILRDTMAQLGTIQNNRCAEEISDSDPAPASPIGFDFSNSAKSGIRELNWVKPAAGSPNASAAYPGSST